MVMTNSEHGQPSTQPVCTESQILGELQTLACSPGFIYALAHAAAANGDVKLSIYGNSQACISSLAPSRLPPSHSTKQAGT